LERKLVKKTYVSYAEAKDVLYRRVREGDIKDVIDRTWEYLSEVGEGDPELAGSIRVRLIEEAGLDEVVAANMVSMCPTTPGEVRSVLMIRKESVYDKELIDQILEILKPLCSQNANES